MEVKNILLIILLIILTSSKLIPVSSTKPLLYSMHKRKEFFSNFQKCQHYVDDFESVYLGNKDS